MRVGDFDQLRHGGGSGAHRFFEQSEEEQAAVPGVAAVDAEGELVEVGLQVFGGDAALVRVGEPALGRAGYSVHPGQQLRRGAPGSAPRPPATAASPHKVTAMIRIPHYLDAGIWC